MEPCENLPPVVATAVEELKRTNQTSVIMYFSYSGRPVLRSDAAERPCSTLTVKSDRYGDCEICVWDMPCQAEMAAVSITEPFRGAGLRPPEMTVVVVGPTGETSHRYLVQ